MNTRNQTCPCGSGKKFKKCCWNKDNVAQGMTVLGVKDMFKTIRYKMLKQFRDTGVLPETNAARQLLKEGLNG